MNSLIFSNDHIQRHCRREAADRQLQIYNLFMGTRYFLFAHLTFLLQIVRRVCQSRNVENWLIFGKDMGNKKLDVFC